jgi:hypothetical protein
VASLASRTAHAPPAGAAERALRAVQLGPSVPAVSEGPPAPRDRDRLDEQPCGSGPNAWSSDWDGREPASWLFHSAPLRPESTRPGPQDASHAATVVVPTLELLLNRLVRRVAWAGDGRAGTMRLELGAGELEGSTVVVHADGGELRVEVDLSPGVDPQAWRARIAERFNASGLHVRELDVH